MSQLQLTLFNTFNVHVQQSCYDLNIFKQILLFLRLEIYHQQLQQKYGLLF